MRLFYLGWPISQTPSAKSLGAPLPAQIPQTVSGELTALTISATVSRKLPGLVALAQRFPLPWSAYVRLLSVKSPAARSFYETEALRGGWSVRQLDRQVNSQFYERIALSKNKVTMRAQAEHAEPGDAITPEEAIKDPFVLEFLNLKDQDSELDLEDALIQHLADFLLELGDDFAFYFRTPEVWLALAEVSGGTNMRRRRLQPSAFLNYEMPVPSMPAQRKLREIHRRAHSLEAKHAAIREANQALLPATLERVFASAS